MNFLFLCIWLPVIKASLLKHRYIFIYQYFIQHCIKYCAKLFYAKLYKFNNLGQFNGKLDIEFIAFCQIALGICAYIRSLI